jgi:hypothetical protein
MDTREEKPIILDEDAPEEDDGGIYPYDPTEKDIDIREDPHTVYELIRKYDQGRLITNPEFQRNLVWKPEQKSKFIESILLNFPLPPWYINQAVNGKYIVVDGLQRTSTLNEYLKDKFALQGLKALPHLNGNKFSELEHIPGNYQARIEDKKIILYVIKPSVPSKVIIDIFSRINTGGTQLNQQEIRNCIFSGASTQLLKKLAETKYFKTAIDEGVSATRMKDQEVILRYLAFQIFDYEQDYRGDMSDFLEKAMKKINKMSASEIDDLKQDFERVMRTTSDFFGRNNFRLPINNNRGRISIAILESVAYFFSKHDNEFLQLHREKIKDNFQVLLQDDQYLDAVKSATSGKNKVKIRFEQAQTILGDV